MSNQQNQNQQNLSPTPTPTPPATAHPCSSGSTTDSSLIITKWSKLLVVCAERLQENIQALLLSSSSSPSGSEISEQSSSSFPNHNHDHHNLLDPEFTIARIHDLLRIEADLEVFASFADQISHERSQPLKDIMLEEGLTVNLGNTYLAGQFHNNDTFPVKSDTSQVRLGSIGTAYEVGLEHLSHLAECTLVEGVDILEITDMSVSYLEEVSALTTSMTALVIEDQEETREEHWIAGL